MSYSFEEVEAWVKAARDQHSCRSRGSAAAYWRLDDLLDDLRLHAVQGIPLTEHACEGGCTACEDL